MIEREGRPWCLRCEQFVRHKDAVWVARRQCRCPVCGSMLERKIEEEAPSQRQPAVPIDPPSEERSA